MLSQRPLLILPLCSLLLACAASAVAQETAAYPNGTSGLKAGTVPPPGRYWLMYNRVYQTNQLNDANGHEVAKSGNGTEEDHQPAVV